MKKFIITIFTITLFSPFANAQMTITPYVQGDFSYAIPFESNWIGAYTYDYHPILSYTFGVQINYDFNKKWSLKTGWFFQNMGEKIERTVLSNSIEIWFDAYKIRMNRQFVNIPIQAQYNFNTESKFSPYVALGTAFNWNLNTYNHVTLYNENKVVQTSRNQMVKDVHYKAQTINFSLNTDVGFRYKFSERFALNTFISGNILLLRTTQSNLDKFHHYNVGLGIGASYTL